MVLEIISVIFVINLMSQRQQQYATYVKLVNMYVY